MDFSQDIWNRLTDYVQGGEQDAISDSIIEYLTDETITQLTLATIDEITNLEQVHAAPAAQDPTCQPSWSLLFLENLYSQPNFGGEDH